MKGKGLCKPTQQEIDDTLVTDAHNHLLRTMKKLTWMLKDKRNGDVDVANEPTYLDINPFPARGSWVSDAR